jgi:hypothetical protein
MTAVPVLVPVSAPQLPLETRPESFLQTNVSAEAIAKKGYFRLSGQIIDPFTSESEQINVVVSDLPVTLGRKDSQPGHINIGKYSSLSREHGRILWDEMESQFYVEIFSKNTSVVDGVSYMKGSRAPLKSKSAILFSNSYIYFLLPAGKRVKKESAKVERESAVKESTTGTFRITGATYAALVGAAFEELSPNNEPLSAREVIAHLLNSHPEWTDRLPSITVAIKKILKRKYSEAPSSDVRASKYIRGPVVGSVGTERTTIDLSTEMPSGPIDNNSQDNIEENEGPEEEVLR